LLFTGTINVDETTQPLSDKVIDPANTLEFFDVDLKQSRKPKQRAYTHNLSQHMAELPGRDSRQGLSRSHCGTQSDITSGQPRIWFIAFCVKIEMYIANSLAY